MRQGIDSIPFPKQQRRPLPSLLYVSFFYDLTYSSKIFHNYLVCRWHTEFLSGSLLQGVRWSPVAASMAAVLQNDIYYWSSPGAASRRLTTTGHRVHGIHMDHHRSQSTRNTHGPSQVTEYTEYTWTTTGHRVYIEHTWTTTGHRVHRIHVDHHKS